MQCAIENLMGFCLRLHHRRQEQDRRHDREGNEISRRRPFAFLVNSSLLVHHKSLSVIRDTLLEHCAAWTVVIVFGVRYGIDYIKLRIRLARLRKLQNRRHDITDDDKGRSSSHKQQLLPSPTMLLTSSSPSSTLLLRIPLCCITHTRSELDGVTLKNRCSNVKNILIELIMMSKATDTIVTTETMDEKTKQVEKQDLSKLSDDMLVGYVHSSLDLRRELSYLMLSVTMLKSSESNDAVGCVTSDNEEDDEASIILQLLNKFQRLWPRFLELPNYITDRSKDVNKETHGDYKHRYAISLIVPMYKEPFDDIVRTLRHALVENRTRQSSFRIQVILVHVVDDPNDNHAGNSEYTTQQFSDALLKTTSECQLQQQQRQQEQQKYHNHDITVVRYTGGGGRGPTLNFGCRFAQGQILTFLHADTLVPKGWDVQIKNSLLLSAASSSASPSSSSISAFPTACAFVMGIDKSSTITLPAAIRGAEWLGILRCYCGLPYGDSVLSFRRSFFEYVGGYPNQPLMEDYEIMDWLRTRSLLFDQKPGESPVLIKSHQALCSPRRWQKHGVAYTSLVNALCIYRYRQLHVPSEDLFNFYYHQQNTKNSSDSSDNKTKAE